ncbi:MAG: elongation factor P--(R)-beta-lysine ligase [Aquificaceae bacterium]
MLIFKEWTAFIDKVREFFRGKGYLEVFTSVLQSYPNVDTYVEPIMVKINSEMLWLRTSPENAMKKLMSEYKEDIFQIGKVFRKDPYGRFHRPEFTMLEWYKRGEDYEYLIKEIGELLSYLGIASSYKVISVEHAFEKYAGIILSEDEEVFKNNLLAYGYEFDDSEDWETLFYRLYVDIERELGHSVPVFLTHFPSRLSAYARIKDGYAERFELYIRGIEIANGWTEEVSKEEIERRMREYLQGRDLPLDQELLNAYEDFPPCAGCSIGLERLFMVLKGFESFDELEFLDY